MKQLFPRGKRIRPTDKDLVFHTALAALFPVFLLVVLLFHIRQIAGTNWQEVSLSQITQDVNIPYLLFSMGVAGLVCLAAVLLFWRYRRDEVKQLIHRQKLARMVLENKWYESEQRKEDAFFKDLSSSRSKETITYFPKIYYRMKQGLLHIRVEITLGKYQEQLLNLERKLESGLYCELTDKELKDSYVEYTLLYDTIANRISIEDVQAKDGRLRLMENVWWEYDKLPHMLIAGGTGGGKTYFILTLIEALLRTNAVLFVLDPKNADLADLQAVMPDVYYKKEDMLDCIDRFYEEMMKRSEDMKLMENYRTGENYAYLGLPANFLIFDEYVAFMEMLGTKENAAVLNKLKQIVMLGRQAGFFLILACQRPDAKYLGDGIRDRFDGQTAQTHVGRAFIIDECLNGQTHFIAVARAQNQHTGDGAHDGKILDALVRRAVFADGQTAVAADDLDIQVRVSDGVADLLPGTAGCEHGERVDEGLEELNQKKTRFAARTITE